jgi:RNA polymerase sigma factor (sigma-70 family)
LHPTDEEQKSTIEKLYILLQKDDFDSFGKALSLLRSRIVRLAKQRLQGEDVEDVIQQTLSTFWEKRKTISKPEHLLPFLFSILRNKLGDTYRRTERRKQKLAARQKSLDSIENPNSSRPEHLYEGKELERILKEAIEICAAENRLWGKVLQLLKEGRSREEIHKELGDIPLATVYTRIHRARQHLIKILKDEFGVEI